MGLQDKINLRTVKGKVGYKITKFQIINEDPGASSVELIAKIYTKDQTGSISPTVDFTESDLIAMAYYIDKPGGNDFVGENVIFDDVVVNQNIFISAQDSGGNTKECNYYIEMESMALSDLESTMLTLKNLRTVTSR